jgi:hypothetical protein
VSTPAVQHKAGEIEQAEIEMIRFAVTLFSSLSILGFSACVTVKPIYYEDDKNVVREKVEHAHKLYNNSDYKSIYDLLTDRVKHEVTQEEFVGILERVKADNGNFLEAKEIDSQVVQQGSFREVRLKNSSNYERGNCEEGYAVFVDGGNAIFDLLMINPAGEPVKPKR